MGDELYTAEIFNSLLSELDDSMPEAAVVAIMDRAAEALFSGVLPDGVLAIRGPGGDD